MSSAPRLTVVRGVSTRRAAGPAGAARRRARGVTPGAAIIIAAGRRGARGRRPWRRGARGRRPRRRRPARWAAVVAAAATPRRAAIAPRAVAPPTPRAVAAPAATAAAAVVPTVTIAVAVAIAAAAAARVVPWWRWPAARWGRIAFAAQHLARSLAVVARPLHLERAPAKRLAIELVLRVFRIANLVKLHKAKALEAPARSARARLPPAGRLPHHVSGQGG